MDEEALPQGRPSALNDVSKADTCNSPGARALESEVDLARIEGVYR